MTRSHKKQKTIAFDILTLFPGIFDSYRNESLMHRAEVAGIVRIQPIQLRDFATGRHHKVDDSPFGGGPGMVLQIEPIYRALQSLKKKAKEKTRVILFSTRGKKLDAKTAKRLSRYDRLVLIAGRYEGVDERVAEHLADEEISVGDYVLSGGELPAMVLIEAVSRYIPGFLGTYESLEDEKGYYPVYTRPLVFKKWNVPPVLLSGDHRKIRQWRGQK